MRPPHFDHDPQRRNSAFDAVRCQLPVALPFADACIEPFFVDHFERDRREFPRYQ